MCSELRGIVDECPERAAGGEGIVERRCSGIQCRDRGVVGGGEFGGNTSTQLSQRSQGSFGRKAGRPELRVAERLSGAGQLARVAWKEREERHSQAAQSSSGIERELVDQHGVGRDLAEDVTEPRGDGLRLPQKIVAASFGLVPQRGDHPLTGRREKRVDLRLRARRPNAAVAARAEGQLDVLVPGGGDKGSKRAARCHDNPVSPTTSGTGDGR